MRPQGAGAARCVQGPGEANTFGTTGLESPAALFRLPLPPHAERNLYELDVRLGAAGWARALGCVPPYLLLQLPSARVCCALHSKCAIGTTCGRSLATIRHKVHQNDPSSGAVHQVLPCSLLRAHRWIRESPQCQEVVRRRWKTQDHSRRPPAHLVNIATWCWLRSAPARLGSGRSVFRRSLAPLCLNRCPQVQAAER